MMPAGMFLVIGSRKFQYLRDADRKNESFQVFMSYDKTMKPTLIKPLLNNYTHLVCNAFHLC